MPSWYRVEYVIDGRLSAYECGALSAADAGETAWRQRASEIRVYRLELESVQEP